ncbi:MAG: ABC-2 transporter permease [Oscillospiraceae bacterium]
MKGLILKDLYVLSKTFKVYGILVLFYGMFGLTTGQPNFMMGMVCVLLAMLPITSLAYDERAKWDKYALTMPINKNDIVLSKYALGLLLSLIGAVISLVASVVIGDMGAETLFTAFACMAIGILYQAIILPIMFKIGTEKGRIVMMAAILVPVVGVLLAVKIGIINQGTGEFLQAYLDILPFVAVAMIILIYVGSVMLSIKFYDNNKEV